MQLEACDSRFSSWLLALVLVIVVEVALVSLKEPMRTLEVAPNQQTYRGPGGPTIIDLATIRFK